MTERAGLPPYPICPDASQ